MEGIKFYRPDDDSSSGEERNRDPKCSSRDKKDKKHKKHSKKKDHKHDKSNKKDKDRKHVHKHRKHDKHVKRSRSSSSRRRSTSPDKEASNKLREQAESLNERRSAAGLSWMSSSAGTGDTSSSAVEDDGWGSVIATAPVAAAQTRTPTPPPADDNHRSVLASIPESTDSEQYVSPLNMRGHPKPNWKEPNSGEIDTRGQSPLNMRGQYEPNNRGRSMLAKIPDVLVSDSPLNMRGQPEVKSRETIHRAPISGSPSSNFEQLMQHARRDTEMSNKSGSTSTAPAVKTRTPPTSPKAEPAVPLTQVERNKIAAQAMKAKLRGKTAIYEKLMAQLQESAPIANQPAAVTVPVVPDNVHIITPLDERGRLLKGLSSAQSGSEGGGGVKSDLMKMVEEEKWGRNKTLDEQYAKDIVKQGKRFRQAVGSRSGQDEDELGDPIGMSASLAGEAHPDSKRAKRSEAENASRQRQLDVQRALTAERRFDKAQSSHPLSLSNPKFRKDLVVWSGKHVMLMLPPACMSLEPNHCRIVPMGAPSPAFTMVDEDVFIEMAQVRVLLQDALKPLTLVYLETVLDPHKLGWQTHVDCIPVEESVAEVVPMFFKKALLEADVEWATHRRVIDTSEKGLQQSIPRDFAYFHVAWGGGGYKGGGYGHIIEEPLLFPSSLGLDVLCGAMGRDPTKFNRQHQIIGGPALGDGGMGRRGGRGRGGRGGRGGGGSAGAAGAAGVPDATRVRNLKVLFDAAVQKMKG